MKLIELPIKEISIKNNVSRKRLSKDLNEMMGSFRQNGVINPPTVVRAKRGYTVVSGHRRYLAMKKLGWRSGPFLLQEKMSKDQAAFNNIAENVVRENPTLAEEGHGYHDLARTGLSADEIAKRVGINVERVKRCLSLWEGLPKQWHDKVVPELPRNKVSGKISYDTAHAIVQGRLTSAQRGELLKQAAGGASGVQIKRAVQDIKKSRKKNSKAKVSRKAVRASNYKNIVVAFLVKTQKAKALEKRTGKRVSVLFREAILKKYSDLLK